MGKNKNNYFNNLFNKIYMNTPIETLCTWFDKGVKENASFMVLVREDWSEENYPMFVYPEENLKDKCKELNSLCKIEILEIYNLEQNRDTQIRKTCT